MANIYDIIEIKQKTADREEGQNNFMDGNNRSVGSCLAPFQETEDQISHIEADHKRCWNNNRQQIVGTFFGYEGEQDHCPDNPPLKESVIVITAEGRLYILK